jgi:hypothetical protein
VSLAKYPAQAQAIAAELGHLLDERQLFDKAKSIASSIGLDGIASMSGNERAKALRLMSQVPSRRAKYLARMDDDAAAVLILRARYLALRAAQALGLARQLEGAVRMNYARAAEMAALAAQKLDNYPSLDDLLERPRWW